MNRSQISSSISKWDAIIKALWKIILRIWIGLISFTYSKKKHGGRNDSRIEHCVDQGQHIVRNTFEYCLVYTIWDLNKWTFINFRKKTLQFSLLLQINALLIFGGQG